MDLKNISKLLLLILSTFRNLHAFKKVLVPAVYKEWVNGLPWWMNQTVLNTYGVDETFVYQKLDPKLPNFISTNRGTEAGVYLRYIVDHYDNLPDVMIFIHAHPEDHSPNWLQLIRCINPNATYMNINLSQQMCRSTIAWSDMLLSSFELSSL
jgi:hypothetical protein